MNRKTFMSELEYLLQDISEEEKADAIGYYSDYLDEAGPEREDEVLREFGSPERIAAMIRANLSGNLEDGGGFTDRGFEDERFRDPNYGVAPRMDLPEGREGSREKGRAGGPDRGAWTEDSRRPENGRERAERAGQPGEGWQYSSAGESAPPGKAAKKRNGWKILCIVLLVIITFPLWIGLFGVGAGALGIGVGILAALLVVLAALLLAAAVWTGAWLFAGVVLIISSFFVMADPSEVVNGLWCLGFGAASLGIGVFSLAVCGLVYGKLLPGLFRLIIDGLNRLVHRGRRQAA